MASKKTSIGGSAAAVTAATAAAAVAAAGAYWFYGVKDAAKHRRAAKSWMLKARAEVLEAAEAAVQKVGEIDKTAYLAIVNDVLTRYAKVTGVTATELAQVARDLKSTWQHMQKASTSSKKVAHKVKRTTKRALSRKK
jgi:hypothetical protein